MKEIKASLHFKKIQFKTNNSNYPLIPCTSAMWHVSNGRNAPKGCSVIRLSFSPSHMKLPIVKEITSIYKTDKYGDSDNLLIEIPCSDLHQMEVDYRDLENEIKPKTPKASKPVQQVPQWEGWTMVGAFGVGVIILLFKLFMK